VAAGSVGVGSGNEKQCRLLIGENDYWNIFINSYSFRSFLLLSLTFFILIICLIQNIYLNI
jgi:hypothetical protein